jgi:hypothetical protein
MCEIWSATVKEENTSRLLEDRLLRRIFGSKREEVTGCWRRQRSEELHNLYATPNIIRVI